MAPTHVELQSDPTDDRLATIAEAVAPGSVVVSLRRLSGGLDNGMHVLELSAAGQTVRRVVLRRFGGEGDVPARRAVREWRVLTLLLELGIAVPEPVLLDQDGTLAGSSAIVISFINGRPALVPSDIPDWTVQVADALYGLHSARTGNYDVRFLAEPQGIVDSATVRCTGRERFHAHPLGYRLRDAMLEAIDDAVAVAPSLTHGDFWPGNVLWQNGRLLAIVDWTEVRQRDPAEDVGYMWMDLEIVGEAGAATEFLNRYAERNGGTPSNLRLAQMMAVSRALPDPVMWMPSWVGAGRVALNVEDVRWNLSQMIEQLTQ